MRSIMKVIEQKRMDLTPKGRQLADFVVSGPGKVVFMTTKELSEACRVSEATVVRFVGQLGYDGYSSFIQALRDLLDTELNLIDRLDLTDTKGPGGNRFQRVVFGEIDNLKQLLESMDLKKVDSVIEWLHKSPSVTVIGSRLSFTLAYYLGWSLTKIRTHVHTLKGSDSTAFDTLTFAPENSLVIIIATTRYPNELIRIGKFVRRLNHRLIVLTDSSTCPLIQFADESLVAPLRNIPFIGSPTALGCLINFIIQELAARKGGELTIHQRKLEQTYWENDVLFNTKNENKTIED
jgi:DNA-binding MurR/RpiR family transcriptional regulator